MMDVDEYNTVVMGEKTINYIVRTLLKRESILVAFKGDEYTQYDLCFSIVPNVRGPVQRGARTGDLMVASMGDGAFCFNISNEPVSPQYVEEKIRVRSAVVADLISRIRCKLMEATI